MNLRKFVPVVALSALLLAGCGAKTVTYAEFHDAAVAVEKHSFTKADVHYVSKTESSSSEASATLKFGADVSVITVNIWVADGGDATVGAAAAILANAPASTVGENEGYTYILDGGNFKVQYNETDYDRFESHGLLVERVSGSATTTISYK